MTIVTYFSLSKNIQRQEKRLLGRIPCRCLRKRIWVLSLGKRMFVQRPSDKQTSNTTGGKCKWNISWIGILASSSSLVTFFGSWWWEISSALKIGGKITCQNLGSVFTMQMGFSRFFWVISHKNQRILLCNLLSYVYLLLSCLLSIV